MKFREWLLDNMSDYLEDIASQGADAGFPHLSYYKDTLELYDMFEDEIWDALYEDRPVEGMSIMSFIASIKGSQDIGDMDQLKNLLVFYMAERTAREIVGE